MKSKTRCVVYLPRRLYRVVEDIMPLFLDMEATDPERGAFTKALEHVIQQYMESEDYRNKLILTKKFRWKLFLYLSDKKQKLHRKN